MNHVVPVVVSKQDIQPNLKLQLGPLQIPSGSAKVKYLPCPSVRSRPFQLSQQGCGASKILLPVALLPIQPRSLLPLQRFPSDLRPELLAPDVAHPIRCGDDVNKPQPVGQVPRVDRLTTVGPCVSLAASGSDSRSHLEKQFTQVGHFFAVGVVDTEHTANFGGRFPSCSDLRRMRTCSKAPSTIE